MAGSVVVIGGTAGLGREVARRYAGRGRDVILTGRDAARTAKVAGELGGPVRGIALELAEPAGIAEALSGVGPVDRLVLAAIDRDTNTASGYDIAAALHLVTLKLIGYTEVVHTLAPRLSGDAAILVFGGMARLRPYPGSMTVSTVNAGVLGMVRNLAVELAPIRVNSIHPGIVSDSPFWSDKPPEVLEAFRSGTLTGRLATMGDVVGAVEFLLENPAVNGVDLVLDGGWR
ncbi:MAG TPA: SDR family oxidoreductase [Micromonosporaceae bacterium]|jgi:NAD(P)-dependent dehydrogenase (short-subunit alcohol dehydrogenase family)|nr:SDR family oxidoreductase [Micromonosporaceae bacterium]